MAQLIGVKLSRFDSTPWGFRLQGGKDFGGPLLIQKVRPVFSIGVVIIAPARLICYFYRTEIILMRGVALLLITHCCCGCVRAYLLSWQIVNKKICFLSLCREQNQLRNIRNTGFFDRVSFIPFWIHVEFVALIIMGTNRKFMRIRWRWSLFQI